MPNGVRMDRAFHSESNQTIMADAAEGLPGPFLCDSCKASVAFVHTHIMNGQDEELRRVVPAFFRLQPGATHAATCSFTARGQIEQLVARAAAVEDEVNPFEPREGGYQFRLNIPMEELQAALRREGVTRQLPPAEFRRRIEAVWNGRRIASYCRSALGLARLWAFMEGRERGDCREAVSVLFRNQNIDWDDFIFPMERYDSLANRLHGTGELDHPAAVLVVGRTPSDKQREAGLISCVAVKNPRIHDRDVRVSPTLRVPAPLYDRFVPGQRYLVFGRWFRGSIKSVDGIEYRGVKVEIHQAAQFCLAPMPDNDEAERAILAM